MQAVKLSTNKILLQFLTAGAGFTFLVPNYPGCHGKEAVKRV